MPKKKSTSKKKTEKDLLPEITIGTKVVIVGDRTYPTAGTILRGTVGTVIAKNRNKYTVEFFEGAAVQMDRKDFIAKSSLDELGIKEW